MASSDTVAPSVHNIPAGVTFVDALATALMADTDGEPERLAAMRVLLPTRRACRSLREAFLRHSGGRALLLPRMTPLGDVDSEDMLFDAWGAGGTSVDGLDGLGADLAIPPAISGLHRQARLARMIMALPGRAAHPAQALSLASALANLVDRAHTEGADLADIAGLVTEDYPNHWGVIVDFLKLITENWPAILAEDGVIDPADRRNRLLNGQAELWRTHPPSGPIIAAGSTGSIPATAALLSVIARLPLGCVVLPGLDRDATDEAWEALAPSHPQYGLARLLETLGVERAEVTDWPGVGETGPAPTRRRLLNAALVPPGAAAPPAFETPETFSLSDLNGITRIDCATPDEEAKIIALAMRRAMATPSRTAALVTPDRSLARRVASELARWDIIVDDSAGRPLAATPPGAFLRLLADAIGEALAPVPLLALLKHPFAAAGTAPGVFRRHVRSLERLTLRGPRPAPGLQGLRDALTELEKNRESNEPELRAVLDRLDDILTPLLEQFRAPALNSRVLLAAHVSVAEALAASDDESGATRLWAGEAGEVAAAFIHELDEALVALPPVAPGDWPAMFDTLLGGAVVRPRHGAHPRLHVWGLLEARLQAADLVILGGLNEDTWPAEVESNPWMSRPMMRTLGLEMPERRIGLAAHDFIQAASAPTVILTRAERIAGTPTRPSRWLLRLDNLLTRLGLDGALAARNPWRAWAAALDHVDDTRRVGVPAPRPPATARPTELPVTSIETWIRDPYALYAQRILELRPLDELDAAPDAADRGNLVHEALEHFILAHPDGDLPDDAERRLLEIGGRVFDEHLARPGVRAFWWPRFRRIARWFVDWERKRRVAGYRTLLTEAKGTMPIEIPGVPFTLTAKPDRIDIGPTGLAVVDYKTGMPPSLKQVKSLLSPQLSLEAAMAMAGAFPGVDADKVTQLLYVHLSGGRDPGSAKPLNVDIDTVAAEAMARLRGMVAGYADAATPYRSRRSPQFKYRFDDYGHLARVKEWLIAEEDGE